MQGGPDRARGSFGAPPDGRDHPPRRGRHRPGDAEPVEATHAPDRSEVAERAARAEPVDGRAQRIDETLTRLTAAHAGFNLSVAAPTDDEDTDLPAGPRRLGSLASRVVVAAVAALVVAVSAVGWGVQAHLDSAVRPGAALDPGSGAVVDAASQVGAENVLLIGTDARSTAPATDGSAEGPRADTIVVAHVPVSGDRVVAVSFPRNLEINRPPCERWDPQTATYLDQTVPAEARTRLVTAYEVGGPRCATRVVQQLTGLAVTRFVAFDLDGVGPLVDAVGGVDVCVQRPVVDGVLGPIVPTAGSSMLDGARARDFVRAQDVRGEPASDRGRVQRQQQLLAAVLDRTLSLGVLLDLGRLGALVPALRDATVSDGAGLDQMLALARSLSRTGADGVTFAAAPVSGGVNGRGNVVLREKDATVLFQATREGAPLPAQPPDAGPAAPAPTHVHVDLLNASGRSGVAGQVGGTLRALGFDVGQVGSAPRLSNETVIRFSPDRATAATLLAATVPAATTVPDPAGSGVLQLVLGRAFDDVVRAPGDTGPAAAATPTDDPPVTCD